MKKIAVLLGYSYRDYNLNTLESSSLDLFNVYNYFQERGFFCYIFTDIEDHNTTLSKSNSDFLLFSSNSSDSNYTKIKEDPIAWLKKNTIDADIVTFYYTGHMTKNGVMYIPLEVDSSFFLQSLSRACRQYSEILVILDCCYSGLIPLPYTYSDGFNLNLQENTLFLSQKVLCLASSRTQSTSSKYRSYFTKTLLAVLKSIQFEHNVSSIHLDKVLSRLVTQLNHRQKKHGITSQTPSILASCKALETIPSYLLYPCIVDTGEFIVV